MTQRTPIPIGGSGLQAGTGVFTTQPSTPEDLREVTLRPGRTARRPALFEGCELESGTDIIGIHALRAYGVTAVVTYDTVLRNVELHLVAPDFTPRLVGTIWTLPAGVAFPRVSMADVWNVLAIAHDEPSLGARQVTTIFTVSPTEGFAPLVLQLDASSGGPPPSRNVRFRGVCRHLTYLVGWGYGTETDPDRPEIVRVSLPDDPTDFKPEHYFLCGQGRDPVLRCDAVSEVLLAQKGTETYTIFGSDRPSFGIVKADTLFGVASSRLAVVVGGTHYRWAFEGPRRSTGGVSEDQSLPLDLEDYGLSTPRDLIFDYAFACYDPRENAVWFVFETAEGPGFAYIYHVEADQWSVRQYPVALFCGGVFVRDLSGSSLGPEGITDFTTFDTPAAPAGALTATGDVDVTVTGTLFGGERCEVWGKPRGIPGATWTKIGENGTVALGVVAVPCVYNRFGVTWDLAARLTLSGIAGAAYRAADPSLWPALTQGSGQVPVPTIASRTASFTSAYFTTLPAGGANAGALNFLLEAPALTQTELTYELRHRLAGSSDPFSAPVAVAALTAFSGRAVQFGIDAVRSTSREIEVRVLSPELTGAWTNIQASRWMGPLTYFGVVVDRETTGQYKWILTAPPEPIYSFDSSTARLQFNVGFGYNDETFSFSFTPSLVNAGFSSVVYTSNLVAGRSNTEVAFRARREIVWQGVSFESIYFITAPT